MHREAPRAVPQRAGRAASPATLEVFLDGEKKTEAVIDGSSSSAQVLSMSKLILQRTLYLAGKASMERLAAGATGLTQESLVSTLETAQYAVCLPDLQPRSLLSGQRSVESSPAGGTDDLGFRDVGGVGAMHGQSSGRRVFRAVFASQPASFPRDAEEDSSDTGENGEGENAEEDDGGSSGRSDNGGDSGARVLPNERPAKPRKPITVDYSTPFPFDKKDLSLLRPREPLACTLRDAVIWITCPFTEARTTLAAFLLYYHTWCNVRELVELFLERYHMGYTGAELAHFCRMGAVWGGWGRYGADGDVLPTPQGATDELPSRFTLPPDLEILAHTRLTITIRKKVLLALLFLCQYYRDDFGPPIPGEPQRADGTPAEHRRSSSGVDGASPRPDSRPMEIQARDTLLGFLATLKGDPLGGLGAEIERYLYRAPTPFSPTGSAFCHGVLLTGKGRPMSNGEQSYPENLLYALRQPVWSLYLGRYCLPGCMRHLCTGSAITQARLAQPGLWAMAGGARAYSSTPLWGLGSPPTPANELQRRARRTPERASPEGSARPSTGSGQREPSDPERPEHSDRSDHSERSAASAKSAESARSNASGASAASGAPNRGRIARSPSVGSLARSRNMQNPAASSGSETGESWSLSQQDAIDDTGDSRDPALGGDNVPRPTIRDVVLEPRNIFPGVDTSSFARAQKDALDTSMEGLTNLTGPALAGMVSVFLSECYYQIHPREMLGM